MEARADPAAVHARVGYVPASSGCTSGCRCAITSTRTPRSAAAPAATGLGPLAERLDVDVDRVHELSHGNKQKIGLVQTFMHEPDLLVLDEPTQGLDPLVQQTFYELLDEARARGGTVFLSSHSLDEVQRVATSVAHIREARLRRHRHHREPAAPGADAGHAQSSLRPSTSTTSVACRASSRWTSTATGLISPISGSIDAVVKAAAPSTRRSR